MCRSDSGTSGTLSYGRIKGEHDIVFASAFSCQYPIICTPYGASAKRRRVQTHNCCFCCCMFFANMMATVELLKYLWPFSWSFNDDIERDTPIHMEKLHKRPRSVKRERRSRRRGQEMSSYTATAFLVIPGGVNALLPLYLPIYAKSSRSVGNKLPKQR